MIGPRITGLVVGGSVQVTWLPDGRFWYRNATMTDTQNVVIDPAKRTREVRATRPAGGEPADGGGGGGGAGRRGRGRATINRSCGPDGTAAPAPALSGTSPH